MSTAPKTWFPTKHEHLYRHKSGVYYARLSLGGNKTWRSLKTCTLSVALNMRDELFKDAAHQKEVGQDTVVAERMTGADAVKLRKSQIDNDPSIKKSTRRYWHEIIAALEKSWPIFLTSEVRRINQAHCEEWTGRCAPLMSSTRFNNTLSMIKSLFEIAIKRGARRTNPADGVKRKKVRTKNLSELLPTNQQFAEFVKTIREAGGRFSRHCADFVEFLAYSGMRVGEAKWVQWRHCDFTREEILVVGNPVDGTKNHEPRKVPMFAATRNLLVRIQKERGTESPTASVLKVHEAQKAMDRAFVQLGMERLTHHDLRHYFATTCLECDVPVPTFAHWLGHKDGGALAMKVYGHHRNAHSLAAASRVSFAT